MKTPEKIRKKSKEVEDDKERKKERGRSGKQIKFSRKVFQRRKGKVKRKKWKTNQIFLSKSFKFNFQSDLRLKEEKTKEKIFGQRKDILNTIIMKTVARNRANLTQKSPLVLAIITEERITMDHAIINKETNEKNNIRGNSISKYPTTS